MVDYKFYVFDEHEITVSDQRTWWEIVMERKLTHGSVPRDIFIVFQPLLRIGQ
jgi:hypothetical protein